MMTSQLNELCFCSYNSTGFGLAAQNHINTLSLFSDVICVQEHFLIDAKDKNHSNTHKIKKVFSDKFDMFIVPAVKDSNQVSRGRGKGGLVTMWKKSLTQYVSKLDCSNFRLQATIFRLPDGNLLLINCYFPCDPRKENYDDEELLTTLADIRSLILNSNCDNILLAGDLNCHFDRQNSFTSTVHDAFNDLGLMVLWNNADNNPDHFIQTVDYTYLSKSDTVVSCSTIDHFGASRNLYMEVKEAGVIHNGENLSPHSAIYVKIKTGNLNNSISTKRTSKIVSWNKATEDAKENF